MSPSAAMRVVSRSERPIHSEDDVVLVRRAVRDLAEQRGFGTFAVAALTTAVSELARNVWVHAKQGKAIIEEISDGPVLGLRILFQDQGPGIPDVARVLKGGYSTGSTLGLGLSGSKRLVDEFQLDTEVGKGTTVTITKWKRF